jgi:hypothetical protein
MTGDIEAALRSLEKGNSKAPVSEMDLGLNKILNENKGNSNNNLNNSFL